MNDPIRLIDQSRSMRLTLAVLDQEGTVHTLVTALTRNLALSMVVRLTCDGARVDVERTLAGIQEHAEELRESDR
jgi:hypothetical protein